MDAENVLLKAAAIETLIPEDSITPLSDLLHDEDAFAESPIGILEVKRRNLLFVGRFRPPNQLTGSYLLLDQTRK